MKTLRGALRATLAAALCLAAGAALGQPVKVTDGHLYRPLPGPSANVGVWLPCNYNPEHERALARVVETVAVEWGPYSIYNLALGRTTPEGHDIACGESATVMANRATRLLPPGWKAYTMDSIDIMSLGGSTSHTIFACEAPDGTVYAMDAYFSAAEITRMKKVKRGDTEVIMPDEAWVALTAFHSGYLVLWGNTDCAWKKVADGANNVAAVDSSVVMMSGGWGTVTATVQVANSCDPNDLYGPRGAGDARWVRGGTRLAYTVTFENLRTAGLPAARVAVTLPLDPALFDMESLQFGGFGFGDREAEVTPSRDGFVQDVDLRPQEQLIVRVTASADAPSGTLTWVLQALDPATMQPPADPLAGFLPPNVAPPEGEGSLHFSIAPRAELGSGAVLTGKATIVFDNNPAIDTPTWFNTLDGEAPVSTLAPLAAVQNLTRIPLQVEAHDAHSGPSAYEIYCSTDGGEYALVPADVSQGSLVFRAEKGKSYAFYSIVRDAAGNREAPKAAADATTRVSDSADEVGLALGTVSLAASNEVSPGVWEHRFSVPLRNSGSAPLGAVAGQLSDAPSYLVPLATTASYGAIEAGATASPSATLDVRVDYGERHTLPVRCTWSVAAEALGVPVSLPLALSLPVPEKLSPRPLITSPADAQATVQGALLDIAGTVAADAKKVTWRNAATSTSGTCTKSKQNWSARRIKLKLGANAITVTALQKSGAQQQASIVVTYVDVAAPTIKVTGAATYTTRKTSVIIAGRTTDNDIVRRVTWSNAATGALGTASGTANWKAAAVALAPGRNVVTITATDASGNPASATVTITRSP